MSTTPSPAGQRRRGQSVLYTVLLMPTLLLVLALSIDVATLQMQRLRLHYAVDLATVTAATSVDAAFYARTGRLRLQPPVAAVVARDYLARNIAPLIGAAPAERIAADAEIVVINDSPAADPLTGLHVDRPSISARIHIPYRMNLLGFLGGFGTGRLTIAAVAEIRT